MSSVTVRRIVRGGWGIYRHEEEFAPYAQAAATAQGYKTTFIQNQSFTFQTVDEQAPINPADYSVDVLSDHDTVRPIYYEYNATISQRLKWNSLLEIAYVGTSSQHLSSYSSSGGNYNEASDINLIPQGYFFQSSPAFCLCNLPNGDTPDAISAMTTAEQDFFRPFPFYQHIYALNHNFYSNYNSVQVSWNKSSGMIQFGLNYTFSKNLDTAASYSNVLVDPVNLRNDYNPDPSDRTHVVNAHYLLDLGKRYHGNHRLISQVANGWQLSGISTIISGNNLASNAGENFGFGSGSLEPTQVATQQQEPNTNNIPCAQNYGDAARQEWRYLLRHQSERGYLAGNPRLSIDAHRQLQSSRRPGQTPVHQPDLLWDSRAGQSHDRTLRPVDESLRTGAGQAAVYPRSLLSKP